MKRLIKFLFPRMIGQGRTEWIVMNLGMLVCCVFITLVAHWLPWWGAFPVGCLIGGVYAVSWRLLVRPRVDRYAEWKQTVVPHNEDHPNWGKK
jgi:membrane protein YdbS with pleckstrin-like domain